jgi:hypothetical protein
MRFRYLYGGTLVKIVLYFADDTLVVRLFAHHCLFHGLDALSEILLTITKLLISMICCSS